jgi:hypothetical protein
MAFWRGGTVIEALQSCRECGKAVSNAGATCPHCGWAGPTERPASRRGRGCLIPGVPRRGCLIVGAVALAAVLALNAIGRRAELPTTVAAIKEGDVLPASGGTRVNERLAGISRDGRALPEDERRGPWACYPTLGDSLRVRTILPEGVYRIAVMSGSERGCEGWVLGSAFATDSELRGPPVDSVAFKRVERIAHDLWVDDCVSQKPEKTYGECEIAYQQRHDSLHSDSTPTAPTSPPASKASVKKQLELDHTRNEGFDNLLVVTFVITNKSNRPVKDIEIFCAHLAPSGTVLGTSTDTIYEIVPAYREKRIPDFNMGFINTQTKQVGCVIGDFELAD